MTQVHEGPDEFTRFEHLGWQKAVAGYEHGFLPLTRQAIEPTLDAVNCGSGMRLVDLASGPGDLVAAAARRGADVLGCDFSEAMLAVARRRHPGLAFRHADAQALPFADGSFDAVTMAFLVGHLSAPDRALAEARRVLAPGGRFAFVWWQGFDRAVPFGAVMAAVKQHANLEVGLPPGPPFDAFADPALCKAALEGAGFHDATVIELPLVWTVRGDELWRTFLTGGVRTTALLNAQEPQALERVRQAALENLATYARADGALVLPSPAWLASAVR